MSKMLTDETMTWFAHAFQSGLVPSQDVWATIGWITFFFVSLHLVQFSQPTSLSVSALPASQFQLPSSHCIIAYRIALRPCVALSSTHNIILYIWLPLN